MPEFEIVTRDKQNAVEIGACASMLGMASSVKKSFKLLLAHLSEAGHKPAGAPYIRYLDINWNDVENESKFCAFIRIFTRKWTMQIGFPTDGAVNGNDIIEAGGLAAGSYAKMMHKGAYFKVGETYKQMLAEIRKRGLAIKNESIEIYLNDPRTTKTEDLETEVLIPLG